MLLKINTLTLTALLRLLIQLSLDNKLQITATYWWTYRWNKLFFIMNYYIEHNEQNQSQNQCAWHCFSLAYHNMDRVFNWDGAFSPKVFLGRAQKTKPLGGDFAKSRHNINELFWLKACPSYWIKEFSIKFELEDIGLRLRPLEHGYIYVLCNIRFLKTTQQVFLEPGSMIISLPWWSFEQLTFPLEIGSSLLFGVIY